MVYEYISSYFSYSYFYATEVKKIMWTRAHRTLHHLFKSYSHGKPQSGPRKKEGWREVEGMEERGKGAGKQGGKMFVFLVQRPQALHR